MVSDQKLSGLEIIQHAQRIATNGDVRLSSTPAQWQTRHDARLIDCDQQLSRSQFALNFSRHDASFYTIL